MVNKIVFAVAGTGLTATAGAGTYFYLTSGYTIQAIFEKNKENKSNLTKSSRNKNQWLENWKTYITDNTPTSAVTKNNSWKVENWTKNKENKTSVPDEFTTVCENKLEDKVSGKDDPEYLNFVKWCVKEG